MSFFRFRGILIIFRGFEGILVIVKVSRVFWSFKILGGYCGHFGGIFVILRFLGYFGHL